MGQENLSEYPEVRRLAELEAEKRRIDGLLRKYVSAREAMEIGNQLFDWAIELDDVSQKIQGSPNVKKEFDYDGAVFSYKDVNRIGFFVSHDGLNLLKILSPSNIESFFRKDLGGRGKIEMLEWIRKNFVDIPKIRLENLKHGGSIALIDQETIKEIVESMKAREAELVEETPPPLPLPKGGFWDFYEREMAEWKKRQNDNK